MSEDGLYPACRLKVYPLRPARLSAPVTPRPCLVPREYIARLVERYPEYRFPPDGE